MGCAEGCADVQPQLQSCVQQQQCIVQVPGAACVCSAAAAPDVLELPLQRRYGCVLLLSPFILARAIDTAAVVIAVSIHTAVLKPPLTNAFATKLSMCGS